MEIGICVKYLLFAISIPWLSLSPGFRNGWFEFIHTKVARIFIVRFPDGGFVKTRISSVISVGIVESLGVGFSLQPKNQQYMAMV